MPRLVFPVLSSLLVGATFASLVACSGSAGKGGAESGSDSTDDGNADPYSGCLWAGENAGCADTSDGDGGVASDGGGPAASSDGSAGDAGLASTTDASGLPSTDGGGNDGSSSDGGACWAVDPGQVPSGVPGQASGACTTAEITAIASEVDADDSVLLAAIQQTSASCQSCALTPGSAATWGAFVEVSPTLVMLDQGACVAQIDSDCGNAINTLFLCEQEACATCTDASSYGSCARDALENACAEYALDATCQEETTDSATSCFPGNDVTDVQLAENILTLQCGSM